MSEPASTPDAGRQARPRLRAILVLALVALVGVLAGVLLDRAVLRDRWGALGRWHGPHAGEYGPGGWQRGGRRSTEWMARELSLTPEQRAAIDSIRSRQQERMRQVMRDVRPQFRAITSETRAQIDSVLTPAQRERLQALRRSRGRSRTVNVLP
jgi:Spy/CpxP family protein refolding chaperone